MTPIVRSAAAALVLLALLGASPAAAQTPPTTPTVHRVGGLGWLAWDVSPSPDVSGYRVYVPHDAPAPLTLTPPPTCTPTECRVRLSQLGLRFEQQTVAISAVIDLADGALESARSDPLPFRWVAPPAAPRWPVNPVRPP